MDPLATSTDAFSPYVAMNNDPASLTDPDGLRVGTELHKAGIMYGPPPPLWAAEWMDAEWIGILSHLMGQRMDWNSGKSEAIWEDVMRAVADQHKQTVEDNTFEPPNFKALFASNYKSDWETRTKSKSKQRKNQWGVIGSEPNDEEPVVTFSNDGSDNIFIKYIDNLKESGYFKEGDNNFYWYGHGARGGLNTDESVVDRTTTKNTYIYNATDFDKIMSSKSSAYKNILESGESFTLKLMTCHSSDLAKKISKAHPNAVVMGVKGLLLIGVLNGRPQIAGINLHKHSGRGEGYFVFYVGGVEKGRIYLK